MEPTIGRIVHYHSYGTPGGEFTSEPRAAIITAVPVDGQFVDLAVFNPTGLYFNRRVQYSETPKPGCWSWPARV